MVVPLLEREKQIGKSAQLSIGGERSGSQQKKKDLLRRLNSLINDGLYKVQLSSMSLSPGAATRTAAQTTMVRGTVPSGMLWPT